MGLGTSAEDRFVGVEELALVGADGVVDPVAQLVRKRELLPPTQVSKNPRWLSLRWVVRLFGVRAPRTVCPGGSSSGSHTIVR